MAPEDGEGRSYGDDDVRRHFASHALASFCRYGKHTRSSPKSLRYFLVPLVVLRTIGIHGPIVRPSAGSPFALSKMPAGSSEKACGELEGKEKAPGASDQSIASLLIY